MSGRSALAIVGVVACGHGAATDPPADRPADPAAAPFTEIPLQTAPGLSGLAADGAVLWTVAERAAMAYRITLDTTPPKLEAFTVEGVPPDSDLEAIAVLGGGRFAFGTEGKGAGTATVLAGELRGTAIAITTSITLTNDELGLVVAKNQGIEGVCGAGDTIVAALEGAAWDGDRRWSPVVVIRNGRREQTHRLWLTTGTGKLSGLDCRVLPDGSITGWAIERHFEVTKILAFRMPAVGDVLPVEVLDLGPVLRARLNLEGIAELPDGRVVAVVDNQWRTITGPSLLLVFERGRLADRVVR